MTWTLWLDDVRHPAAGLRDSPEEHAVIRWARDAEQAQFYVRTLGPPSVAYLDHDLAPQHYVIGSVEPGTGMDFLRWLAEEYPDCIRDLRWAIISANPDGRANMRAFLESWERSQGQA